MGEHRLERRLAPPGYGRARAGITRRDSSSCRAPIAVVSPGTGTQSGVGAKTSLAGHAMTSVVSLTSCQPGGDGQASNLQGLRTRTRQTPSEFCSSKSHSAQADAATKKLLAEEAAEQGKGRARSKKSNKMEKAGPAATRDESSKALDTAAPAPPFTAAPKPAACCRDCPPSTRHACGRAPTTGMCRSVSSAPNRCCEALYSQTGSVRSPVERVGTTQRAPVERPLVRHACVVGG